MYFGKCNNRLNIQFVLSFGGFKGVYMIHDINKSKSKFAIGFIVLLFFSCAFLVAYNFIYQINNINEQFKFDSEEAAIIDGVSKEANKIVLPEDLQKNIILSKEHNGSFYGCNKHGCGCVVWTQMYTCNCNSKHCKYQKCKKNNYLRFIRRYMVFRFAHRA